MFYFSKKTIASFIILLVFCIGMSCTKTKTTVQTVATPVSDKTVILDARASGPQIYGGQSKSGVTESEINLKVVLKIQKLLEQSGFKVILTRSDENGIYDLDKKSIRDKKISDTKKRVQIANTSNADVFISIHQNTNASEKQWGWQTYFKQNNEQGIKLSKSIQENLNKIIEKENKREALKITGKYIIDNVKIPITLVECGFLTNTEEAELLQKDEYQDKLAWGIYLGIVEYFY